MSISKQLQPLRDDSSPAEFLDFLSAQSLESLDDFFIFSGSDGYKQFIEAIDFLHSNATLSQEDLGSLKAQPGFHYICQTIDGDYLLATSEQVLVVPSSLNKTDIERYALSIVPFFLKYEDGSLSSKILPKNY